MKLNQLHLLESKCPRCGIKLTDKDAKYINPSKGQVQCKDCTTSGQKAAKTAQDESDNMAERGQDQGANLLHVSQSVPDRSYDKDRGTPRWLMGEPSPGRSF